MRISDWSSDVCSSDLYADDAPLAVVLGFRPVVPGAYGRIIAGRGGMIEKMVEYKDASEEERAVTLCNSGLMAVRQEDLFTLLARVENNNAAGEYYLPDIVMLDLKEGRRRDRKSTRLNSSH